MKIKWTLDAPLERHFHNFCSVLILSTPFTALITCYYAIFVWPFLNFRLIVIPILYAIYFYIDKDASETGGWTFRPMRTLRIWNFVTKSYPIKIVKTSEVDPDRNYLFCLHPHSHLPQGSINFLTECNQITQLYHGLRFHVQTLTGMLQVPILREVLLMGGVCSVSKKSFHNLLTNCGKGNALTIYPGGDQEGKLAAPRTMKVFLKSRKGFVRMAIKYGVDLVPVINFGENDAYDNLTDGESGVLVYLQELLYRKTRIFIPLISGRGFFQDSFGLLPFLRPITSVIGKPIRFDRTNQGDPSDEEVDTLHREYISQLTKLYYNHRVDYGYGDIEFVVE